VYVSHDQVFSEPILRDFEKETRKLCGPLLEYDLLTNASHHQLVPEVEANHRRAELLRNAADV
jgi:hypothetical protein